MSINDILTIVSVVAAIAGVCFGVTEHNRNKKQDDTADGKESGVILTELGYIKSGVDDVKRTQERQDEQMRNMIRDLTVAQESVKSAHHRIDSIEHRMNET